MDEEKVVETVRTLSRLLATFEGMKTREMLRQGHQTSDEHTLEDAYAALVA